MAEYSIIGDRFDIGHILGEGGMSTVYVGADIHTGRLVAIKKLKPDIITLYPDTAKRFDREGQALRKLNHPNIVKVIATIYENENQYVVMEYIDSGDLRTLIDTKREQKELIPMPYILALALDISDALSRAHRLSIVHRDIKPSNILLASDGTPRLTDFGVAYMEDALRMTKSGMVIGTLNYISPEACRSKSLDLRTDVWSLGVMLYEMLTLRSPFAGIDVSATAQSIMYREVPSLLDLRPDTPPALEKLIQSMLMKDRDLRISSARWVGAKLDEVISNLENEVSNPPAVAIEEDEDEPPSVLDDTLFAFAREASHKRRSRPTIILTDTDPHGTKILDEVAPKSLIPDRLRVVMPDRKVQTFEQLFPQLLVGRNIPATKGHSIDLSPFDAGVFGVSRFHAQITPDDRRGLILTDLKSLNGTFLNGQQVPANQPQVLHDGDRIKLGNLRVQIFFEKD
jgi:serine/threonine protein kinase